MFDCLVSLDDFLSSMGTFSMCSHNHIRIRMWMKRWKKWRHKHALDMRWWGELDVKRDKNCQLSSLEYLCHEFLCESCTYTSWWLVNGKFQERCRWSEEREVYFLFNFNSPIQCSFMLFSSSRLVVSSLGSCWTRFSKTLRLFYTSFTRSRRLPRTDALDDVHRD